MTDSQRSCFMAVAEHHSFSRAAEALYVSQPAVSKNIATLEAEMRVPLFDRQGKYVVLTKAGEIFLSFLTEYNREYDAMMKRIRSLGHSTPHGTLRIGCGLTWNAGHFHTRLSRHLSIHFPGILLEVEGLEADSFIPSLRRKDIDLMIMYGYELDKIPDIEFCPLLSLGTGFLCSSALPGSNEGSLELVSRRPFLSVESHSERRSSFYRQLVSDICEKKNVAPEFVSCRSLTSGLVDVSCGKGSLLVDDWTAAISNSEFRYIPTGETAPVSLVWLRNSPDPILKLVIEETKKVFSDKI